MYYVTCIVNSLFEKKHILCIFLLTTMEHNHTMNFGYEAKALLPFGCHGDRVDAAIAKNHKFIHISDYTHGIIINDVSSPIFLRSNITLNIFGTKSGTGCCHGNHFDSAIAKYST